MIKKEKEMKKRILELEKENLHLRNICDNSKTKYDIEKSINIMLGKDPKDKQERISIAYPCKSDLVYLEECIKNVVESKK